MVPGGDGIVRMGAASNVTATEGALLYDKARNCLVACDGTDWFDVGCAAVSDNTPDAFSFTDQTGVAVSTLTASNSVTITGITGSVNVSVTGGGNPQVRINGGAWATSGVIENGQSLEVRLTSSGSHSTMHSATVSVGTVSDQWDVTTGSGGPTGCPNIGDVCTDGSVYAGLSPDGNVAMYTTPADAPGTYTWNDGSSNWVDTAMVNCTNGTPGSATSCRTGEANTALLVGLSGSGSPAPYEAAEYCDSLSAHGQTDWYLPAQDELDVLYDNHAAIGGFNAAGSFPAGWYWSSSERATSDARAQRFSDGSQDYVAKRNGIAVRCVRRH